MKALSYDNIALVPNFSTADSRSNCDVSIELFGKKYKLPIIPANMKASIDFEKAEQLAAAGYFYIMHRFEDYTKIFEWIKSMQKTDQLISISLGVKENDYQFLKCIQANDLRVDYITIDIAHGHCTKMMDMINNIKSYSENYKIIAGNVATWEGVEELAAYGADIVKVGIGQGHTCSTRLQTGFGLPMVTCLSDINRGFLIKQYKRPIIIADGGISHYGDAAKALVLGADMVMSGSMFARCIDSPAETIQNQKIINNTSYNVGPIMKRWYGSASEYNNGNRKHIEGFEVIEETNYRTYSELLAEWEQSLQSSCSYGGVDSVKELSKKVKYVLA